MPFNFHLLAIRVKVIIGARVLPGIFYARLGAQPGRNIAFSAASIDFIELSSAASVCDALRGAVSWNCAFLAMFCEASGEMTNDKFSMTNSQFSLRLSVRSAAL
jgi:hypothetical protein